MIALPVIVTVRHIPCPSPNKFNIFTNLFVFRAYVMHARSGAHWLPVSATT